MTSLHGTQDRSPDSPAPGAASFPNERLAEHGWLGQGPGSRGRLLVLVAAVLLVLWLARGIVGPFVVAAVLAYAFAPVVTAFQQRTGLPRALVIGIGYVVFLTALGVGIYLIAHAVNTEIKELTAGGQDIIAGALHKIVGDHLLIAGQQITVDELARQIRLSLVGMLQSPSDALHIAEQAFELALQVVLCLIVTFYFLLDGHRFGLFAMRFLARSQREESVRIAHRIHVVLGRWLRGQILLIGLVTVVLYAILGPILHVPYALLLAIISGVLEIIPLVGPVIAAALAGTVAFSTKGTDVTLVVLLVYLVVRQVEDQVVMPLVIGRAVHLHPVATIFAVLVGLSAFGILGGLLGVPVAAALNVTLHELYPQASEEEPAAATDGTRDRKVQWVAAGAARVGGLRQARESAANAGSGASGGAKPAAGGAPPATEPEASSADPTPDPAAETTSLPATGTPPKSPAVD